MWVGDWDDDMRKGVEMVKMKVGEGRVKRLWKVMRVNKEVECYEKCVLSGG